ncbi:uncharacterized protein LOC130357903 [Hyla sarda]|uniref:uncharacterized protein LOC130357903 n=1 Tax=Hyla sarda TaxID=327740 RepID=UPI0024C2A8EF|nr:uncharacterized protein LOC130357903 [Hyla sarda]
MPQQEGGQSSGVEPGRISLSSSSPEVWSARDGCHGNQSQSEASALLLHLSEGPPRPSRRPVFLLEQQISLCFPSIPDDPSDASQDQARQGQSTSNSSILAKEVVVPAHINAFEGLSLGTASPSGPASSGRTVSSCSQQVKTHSLAPERLTLVSKGLSEDLIDLLSAPKKNSTLKVYSRVVKAFQAWCMEHHITNPNISQVLQFLKEGFDKGLKPNTIQVPFSAINDFQLSMKFPF